jgi:hypothetical protein
MMIMANFHDDYGKFLFYNRDDRIRFDSKKFLEDFGQETLGFHVTSPAAGIFCSQQWPKKTGKNWW